MPKIIKTMGEGHAKGELYPLLDAFLVDIAAQKVIIDELILDHATYKAVVDELVADHATFKTCVDAIETLIEELHDDHATSKTVVTDIKTLLNDIKNRLAGDGLMSLPGLVIGSTTTAVANVAFDYIVNGAKYTKAAVVAGTAPGNDVIPTGTYGAVALDIGADGTIDVIEATDNATGYASAVLAIAGLAAVAADHVRMGTVTVIKSDGAFTFGTTALSDANTTEVYTDNTCVFAAIGAVVGTSAPDTLGSAKPASAPATLTNAGPGTLTAVTTALTVTS